jgi:cyclic lactone autoinducer peptide
MKTNKNNHDKAANYSKKIMRKVAEHYANVACPLMLYQPVLPDAVKSLRKK